MKFFAFFTENGTPKTGLSPTINIWEDDGTQVVNTAAMTEIASGFYKYDYTNYDDTKDYIIIADGGATLPTHERYNYSSNETGSIKTDTEDLLKVQKNKWDINSNVLTIYDDDGITPLFQFDLKDKNGVPTSRNVFQRIPK